ncbi:MAG: hydrogenase/urease maturation nickel metallochaperone HypA [Candidatus Bathyarchaeia archaeon]
MQFEVDSLGMHEYALMKDVVESILKEAEKYNAKKVTEVQLALGKFLLIGLEEARFAYEALVKGTLMENSDLRIEEVDPKVKCTSCGYLGNVEVGGVSHTSLPAPVTCPRCGGRVQILEGKECIIKSFKFETE